MKKVTMILTLFLVCGLLVSRVSAGFSDQELTNDEAYAWLKDYLPEAAADLDIIRGISPNLYMEIMEEVVVEIPDGEELRQTDPKLFEFFSGTEVLEIRSLRLSIQLVGETDKEKREAMKAEIRSLVEQVFNQRLEQHKILVKEIERELAELKRAEKVRAENRNKVIEQRYKYLIDPDSEALEWW